MSKIMRDTKNAVKTDANRPISSVTANPLIGPVPNWKRKSAEMIVVMCVSMIVPNAREKPCSIGGADGLAFAQLLADALEDQHVRIDGHAQRQDDAGDARQRQRGLEVRHHPQKDDQVQQQCQHGVDARAAVVDEHGQDQQRRSRSARRVTPWRIESRPSDGPTVRSSSVVSDAGSEPLRRTSARSRGLLLREAALDHALIVDLGC